MNKIMEKDNSISPNKIAYPDSDIAFMMDGESVYVGNIVYECFKRSIPMHAHSDNSYEIHYISSGHGKVTVEGRDYDTLPGTLYITGPHVRHSMIPDSRDPLAEYCIYLKLSADRNTGKKILSPLKAFKEMSIWYGHDKCDILELMKSLFTELEKQSLGYRTVVESLIKQIIISCVRNYSAEEEKNAPKAIKAVDRQYLVIEESFLYDYATLTLTELSERLNLSSRQTQRLLTQHYGMNFQRKKTEAKMSAAALMLGLPDKTITDIAEELGYSSVEHFSTAFKKYYGTNAGRYRENV